MLRFLQSDISIQVRGQSTSLRCAITSEDESNHVTGTVLVARESRYHSRDNTMISRDSLVSVQSPSPHQRAPQAPHGYPSFASAYLKGTHE